MAGFAQKVKAEFGKCCDNFDQLLKEHKEKCEQFGRETEEKIKKCTTVEEKRQVQLETGRQAVAWKVQFQKKLTDETANWKQKFGPGSELVTEAEQALPLFADNLTSMWDYVKQEVNTPGTDDKEMMAMMKLLQVPLHDANFRVLMHNTHKILAQLPVKVSRLG